MKSAVFIVAGEPSGDRLAAHIMRVINQNYKDLDWGGVGGADGDEDLVEGILNNDFVEVDD